MTAPVSDLVWYAAYGSNMAADRLGYYLTGGRPPGALRTYPGARDPSSPRQVEPVWLPGRVYFALKSKVWGGGMAFYDPAAADRTPARAYLLTVGQFSDLAAQEMHRLPASDLELGDAVVSGHHQFGPGRYETLVCPGHRGSVPILTLTAPWHLGDVPLNAPSGAYLRMLGTGLREAQGWSAAEAGAHLAALPGAAGAWTADEIADLLTDDLEVAADPSGT